MQNYRPIDTFKKYFLEVKPYHTKILEILEKYNLVEDVKISFAEDLFFNIDYKNNPLCRPTGFGIIWDGECGFDALDCCDVFNCVGGYGVIFDNSEQVAEHSVLSVDYDLDTFTVSGDRTRDTRLQISSVPTSYNIRVNGNVENILKVNGHTHSVVAILPVKNLPITTSTENTITVPGNHASIFLPNKELQIYNTSGSNGIYRIKFSEYYGVGNTTVITLIRRVHGEPIIESGLTGMVEVRTPSRNNGIYLIDSVQYDGTLATDIILHKSTPLPYNNSTEGTNHGSIQLRTALVPDRTIYIEETATDLDNNYRVIRSDYNIIADTTTVFVSADIDITTGNINAGGLLRMYGYTSEAGYDGRATCETPKHSNISVGFSEKLVIVYDDSRVTPIPTTTPTPTPVASIPPTPCPSPTPLTPVGLTYSWDMGEPMGNVYYNSSDIVFGYDYITRTIPYANFATYVQDAENSIDSSTHLVGGLGQAGYDLQPYDLVDDPLADYSIEFWIRPNKAKISNTYAILESPAPLLMEGGYLNSTKRPVVSYDMHSKNIILYGQYDKVNTWATNGSMLYGSSYQSITYDQWTYSFITVKSVPGTLLNVSLVDCGCEYNVLDVLTFDEGDGGATIIVTSIDDNGGIVTAQIYNGPYEYTTIPSNPNVVSTSGGSGFGAKFAMYFPRDVKFFIDGVEDTYIKAATYDFDRDFVINGINYPGSTNTAYGGNALTNHIKIYNRTVSPAEVASKYSEYSIVDDNYTPIVSLDSSIGSSVTWTGESIAREWAYTYPTTESHTFKPDGTTFYMAGRLTSDPFGNAIREYKLETPWVIDPELNSYCIDPSNGYWYVTNTLPASRYTPHRYDNVDEHMHVTAFSFSHDGTKAYIINEFHRDTLMQFTLQTPFEFMELTYDGFIGIEESSASEDITFNDTGTIIYLTNSTDDKIIKISLGIAWDISSETNREVINLSVAQPVSTSFKSDGTKVYFYSKATDTVYQYTCATPWDIATATDDSISQLISEVSVPAAFRISSDGTRALAVSASNGTCYSYDLSVVWDLTTLVHDSVTLLNTLSTSLDLFIGANFDIFTISSDGTKIFRGIDNTTIVGFDLPSAWDISSETMFPEPTITLSEINTIAPADMQFSPTGSNVIVVSSYREWTSGIYKNKVYSWTLSTPWDLSSATYNGYKYINYGGSRFISGPYCVHTTSDGLTMFIGGDQTYGLQKFTLSTPWNVTTAGSPTTYTTVGRPNALYFTDDGLTMITASGTSITKRTLASPYNIASAVWQGTVPIVIDGTINTMTIANSGTTLFALHGITLSKFTVSPALEFNTTPLKSFYTGKWEASRNGEYVVSCTSSFNDPAQPTVSAPVYDLPVVYKKNIGGWTLHGYGDPAYSNIINLTYVYSVDVTDDGNLVFVVEGSGGEHIHIFELVGNIYTFRYKITRATSSSVEDRCSISSDGNVVVQTFYYNNPSLENNLLSGIGVYRRNGNVWDLEDILYPEYGGTNIYSSAYSNTGFNAATISGDGTRVMFTGVADPFGAPELYAPQIFKYSGGSWTYENSLPLGQLSNLIPSSVFSTTNASKGGGRLGSTSVSINYAGLNTTFMSTDGSVMAVAYTAVYHPLDQYAYLDNSSNELAGVLMYRENQGGGSWNLTNVLRNPIPYATDSAPRAEYTLSFNIGGNSTGDRIILRDEYKVGIRTLVFDYNNISDKYEFVHYIYDPTLDQSDRSGTGVIYPQHIGVNVDGTEVILFVDAYSGINPRFNGNYNPARGGKLPFKYTLPAIGTLSKVTFNNPAYTNWDTELDLPYVNKIDHRCPYVGFHKAAVNYNAAQWGTQTIIHGTTSVDTNEYNSVTMFSSGKKYVEFEYRCATNEVARVGIRNFGDTGTLGNDVNSYACVLGGSYPVTYNNSVATDFVAKSPILNKDILGIAVDFDTGNLWFSVNGQWISDGDPSTGTSPNYVIADLTSLKTFSLTSMVSSSPTLNPTKIPTTVRARTGISQLTFTVPSGFEPWDNSGPTALSYDDLSVYDRILSHYQTPVGRWSFNNQYITGDVISDRVGSNNLTLSSSSSLTYIDSDAGIDGCFVDLQLDTPASHLEFDQEIKFGRNEKWGLLFWQYFYDDDDTNYVGTILSSSELGVDNNEFILTKRAFWLSVYASDGTTSSTQEISTPAVTEGFFGLIGLQGNGDGTIKIFTGTSWSEDITLPGNSQFAVKYIGARDATQNPSNGFTSSMVLYDDMFYQVYTSNKQINDTWYYWTPGNNTRTLIEVPQIRGTHIRSDYDSMSLTTYESYVTPRLLEIVSDYASLTLTAYSNVADPNKLSSGVPRDGTVASDDWDYYSIDTVPGTTQITVVLSNMTGDVDLYTNYDTPPDYDTWYCRPYTGGLTSEQCTLPVTHPRTVHIGVNGYDAGDYTVTATLS